MKTGKLVFGGFLGLTLAAFAMPCWGSINTAPPTSRQTSVLSGAQYAGGPGEHEEHEEHEHEFTAPVPGTTEHEEHERMEHGGEEEEHGGARNMMKEHVPGTTAHQRHEEREGEEHHSRLHHDND